jgi:hypothetical protein
LIAAGVKPREAGREAGIDAWRAFGLGMSADFWRRVTEHRRQLERDA